MFKILMTYKSTEGLDALLGDKNFSVAVHPKPDAETFKKLIADADGLLIRSEVKVTRDVIAAAGRLKLIARAGTGVDNVDVPAATEKGIAVMNVPGGNTIAAAEHTMALILALVRNIPQACASLKSRKWEREKFVGTELFGKTLGLVGFGRIAREVAVRAKSFGMSITVYDPFVSPEFAKSLDILPAVSLDALLETSDIVSVHAPLNDSTKNLINKAAISKMKNGAFLVNAARGPIINEKDLADALASGRIKAAIDVFAKEPPEDFCVIDSAAAVVTPHLGASTEEAQIKIAREIAECIADFFAKGAIRNAVNMPSLDAEAFKAMKPYLDLAEQMGSFHSQIIDGSTRKISLAYAGAFPDRAHYFLTLAYLKGFLSRAMDEPVSYVNAALAARSRGIVVAESHESSPAGYNALMTAAIETSDGKSETAGTVFAADIARIVKVDGLPVDVAPAGCMLFLTNTDRPGIIGKIGTYLGAQNINIGNMDVARNAAALEALTFINIDACPDSRVFDGIKSIEGVKKVKFIKI